MRFHSAATSALFHASGHPAAARLVERALLPQLQRHFDQVGLLPDSQHGFRAGRSCETAIAHLVQLVARGRDRGDVVLSRRIRDTKAAVSSTFMCAGRRKR